MLYLKFESTSHVVGLIIPQKRITWLLYIPLHLADTISTPLEAYTQADVRAHWRNVVPALVRLKPHQVWLALPQSRYSHCYMLGWATRPHLLRSVSYRYTKTLLTNCPNQYYEYGFSAAKRVEKLVMLFLCNTKTLPDWKIILDYTGSSQWKTVSHKCHKSTLEK